jgi:hypothetical protein
MKIQPATVLHSRSAMTLLSALILAACLPLLSSCRPTIAPSRGDPVVSDAEFFGSQIPLLGLVNETRAYLDKELEKSAARPVTTSGAAVANADLSLTADFHLPTGVAPLLSRIIEKYGQPDRSEPASAKEGPLTVHYYGDIGLGVSGPAETGTVTRIYVRRTKTLEQ